MKCELKAETPGGSWAVLEPTAQKEEQVSWGVGGFCVEHTELELQDSTGCFPLLLLISNTRTLVPS